MIAVIILLFAVVLVPLFVFIYDSHKALGKIAFGKDEEPRSGGMKKGKKE